MRLLTVLLLLAALFNPLESQASDPGVAVRSCQLMSEPFKDARSVILLREGDTVEILKRKGGWLNVIAKGKTGWVRMLYIRRGEGGAQASVATEASGVLGLATGRAGKGNVVAATGVRGLDEENLKEAEFNEKELRALKTFASSAKEAKAFAKQAGRVTDLLKKKGVKKIITVDPHTTHTLRTVFPEYVKDFDLEVKSYLEVLAQSGIKPARQISDELSLHDSCVYARHENVVEQPRALLAKTGATVNEPRLCGKNTHCCGGPLESLFPSESHRIAGNRAEQLKQSGGSIATMCPICLVSLRKAAKGSVKVNDLSDTLAKAYGV